MRFTAKAKHLAKVALAFAGLSALLAVMAGSYRTLNAEMKRMDEELAEVRGEYYTESMRSTSLYAQINEADEDAFIERVARREYKYTNPGEIHYTISNLPGADAVETGESDAGEAK